MIFAQQGILPWRGSLMLDVVFLAMFAIVPALAVSVYLTKFRRAWGWHKRIQIALGIILLVAVTAFEIDMRLFTDWTELAGESPYFDPAAKWSSPVGVSLLIHLAFAIPTAALWAVVTARALLRFERPPRPGPHSRSHAFWGWLAAGGMTMTAVTGWIFYGLAFIAERTAG